MSLDSITLYVPWEVAQVGAKKGFDYEAVRRTLLSTVQRGRLPKPEGITKKCKPKQS